MSTDNRLKAYVRFDGSGRIVPSSLILQRFKPSVGKWKEIDANECCNYTPTTTTTSTSIPVLYMCETLGRAANFAVIGASTVTNTGTTVVTGDLGLYPGTSVTGFPPGVLVGTEYVADTTALAARTDAEYASDCIKGIPATVSILPELGGLTLEPGVYDSTGNFELTGTLILDGKDDPNAVFIFRSLSTFIVNPNSEIIVINSAAACNVYWIVESSATFDTNSIIVGNVIANDSITLNTNANLYGRAIALTGAVTMDTNSITACDCTTNPCI